MFIISLHPCNNSIGIPKRAPLWGVSQPLVPSTAPSRWAPQLYRRQLGGAKERKGYSIPRLEPSIIGFWGQLLASVMMLSEAKR